MEPRARLEARLDHALKHLSAFEVEAQRFLDAKPYALIREDDPHGGRDRWRVQIRRPIPAALALIAGDCTNALRSTLDNLTWAIALKCSSTPPENTAFVIARSEERFHRSKWKLKGLPTGAVDEIERVQPYALGNLVQPIRPDPSTNPDRDALWMLERLWNDDKHRAPALVAGLARVYDINFSGLSLPPQSGVSFELNVGAFKDGDVLVRSIPVGEPFKGEFEPEPEFQIAFEEEGPARGTPVVGLIRTLHDLIRDRLIPRFEPYL